jgi:hypothetical protein
MTFVCSNNSNKPELTCLIHIRTWEADLALSALQPSSALIQFQTIPPQLRINMIHADLSPHSVTELMQCPNLSLPLFLWLKHLARHLTTRHRPLPCWLMRSALMSGLFLPSGTVQHLVIPASGTRGHAAGPSLPPFRRY